MSAAGIAIGNRRGWRRLALLGALAALSACATSPYKRAGNAGEVASALARSRPAAVGRRAAWRSSCSAARPGRAWRPTISRRRVWSGRSRPRSRPASRSAPTSSCTAASRSAPGDAGAVVVARDIGNGAVLWQNTLAADERLAGYDIDADAVYLVVQKVGATKRETTGSVVALDPRTGTVRWRHLLPTGRVAGPAVARRPRRGPGRFAVRDPARRRDGRRAGAGAVDRGGGDVRARAARGDVLRLARRVPAVAVDRARVAPGAGIPAGAPAGVRPAVLLVRPLPSRAGSSTRPSTEPHPVARDRRGRARALPRRHRGRARLPLLVRVRRDVGRAALGLQPSGRRGGVDGHRQRHRVRQQRRRHRRARSRDGRAPLSGPAAGRGRPRRDLRRGGIFADVWPRAGAAPDLVATLGGDRRRSGSAVPRSEAVRDRGARPAARARGDRQAAGHPERARAAAARHAEDQRGAGGAARHAVRRSAGGGAAVARRLRGGAHGAAGRVPGEGRGRARSERPRR